MGAVSAMFVNVPAVRALLWHIENVAFSGCVKSYVSWYGSFDWNKDG